MALGAPSPCGSDSPQCRLARTAWHSLHTCTRSGLCLLWGFSWHSLWHTCCLPNSAAAAALTGGHCWLATEPGSLSLPLCRQSLMQRSQGAASPGSQACCAAPFGQVIDSSVIVLNGSCIGIQGHLWIRETRSLAVIGPPCVR